MTSIYKQLSKERKELQHQGLNPDWVTTGGWQLFREKYLYQSTGMKGTYERIAKTAARHTPKPDEWAARFFDVMWNGWLACSTPVLSNMGTPKGMPVSCSGAYIDDSIHGFYTARHDTAMLTKNGFGTSGYLGDIRPRGSKIASGGTSSGVLPVVQMFVDDMRKVAQGTARRGAWAGYLEMDHADYPELVDYLEHYPDDLNLGWIITDKFIERLNNGDIDAHTRLQRSMKVKAVTGKGYYLLIDNVNRLNPQMYKDLGLEVKASNLCLTGDTTIRLLGETEFEISLEEYVKGFDSVYQHCLVYSYDTETSVYVWKSVTAAAMTGVVDELYEIETPNGNIIKCTPEHQIFTTNRGWVQAQELVETDTLVEC